MRVYCTIMFYYVISQGFDNFHVFLNPIYPTRKREGGEEVHSLISTFENLLAIFRYYSKAIPMRFCFFY